MIAPLAFIAGLQAQVTREEADDIVLARFDNSLSYIVYAKENVQKQGITIEVAPGKEMKFDYSCWVYYISYTNNAGCYWIVNEDKGNVLEINVKSNAEPEDLAEWRMVKNWKIDFSNIEDLYAQPLEIIQNCVHGKWKVLEVLTWGFIGTYLPTNTIVSIDTHNNYVVITEYEDEYYLNGSFSYSWEEKEVYQFGQGVIPRYTTYVMQNNDKKIEGWYFDRIRDDILFVYCDFCPDRFADGFRNYIFLKIKNDQ